MDCIVKKTQVEETPSFAGRPWIWMLMALFLVQYFFLSQNAGTRISYSEFNRRLALKEVDQVVVSSERIEGAWKNEADPKKSHFMTYRVEDPSLVERLNQSGVTISGAPQERWSGGILTWIGSILLLVVFWRFLFGRLQGPQSELLSFGKSKAKVYVERDLKTKFVDVAGVDEAKAELLEVVEFLKSPDRFTRLGGRMPKGILLVGPPGTGKTLMARAVAGEAGVSFFSINGSEFVELFVGLGAARVRDLFEQARKSVPCILFIDELDALGKARGISAIAGGANEEKEQTLNQLLAEIDGFDPSPGIVLLAATNRPEILDPALLRSGRFDRQIAIDKPDRKGRLEILKIHLKKVKLSPEVNPDEVASITTGFSGADLENLVNEAALVATRRNAERVESQDFLAGVERIVGGLERKSRVIGEEEKKKVAFHEMGHATVSLALDEKLETIHKVSIIPRGIGALGYTMKRPIEDRYLMSQHELEDQLAVLLGGRASEAFFFNERSTGAADDLDRATDIARAMIMQYGMGEKTGMLTYEKVKDPYLKMQLGRMHEFSEDTAQKIDIEIRQMVDRAYHRALSQIEAHSDYILKMTELLLQQESLGGEELLQYWEGEKKNLTREKITPVGSNGVIHSSLGTGTNPATPTH
jgi:cell division protease FtsH